MPRVVIEEFVNNIDDDEDGKTGESHSLVTHHEIDDVSNILNHFFITFNLVFKT